MDKGRNMKNECWTCKFKREVPMNYHIMCIKPDKKMVGHPHGIKNGWFYYPGLFDPLWKMKDCDNYKEIPEGVK